MKVPDFVRADINRQDQELKKYGKAGTAFDEHLKLIKKIDSKEIHVKMVPTLKSNKEHPLLPKVPPFIQYCKLDDFENQKKLFTLFWRRTIHLK